MKEITFGIVFESGLVMEKEGERSLLKFANGAELFYDLGIIPTIAKEIARINSQGKEVDVCRLCNGVIISYGNHLYGKKLFSSTDIKLDSVDKIIIKDEGEEKVIKRVQSTLWKSEEGILKYHNQKYVAIYLFGILLMKALGEPNTLFSMHEEGKVIRIAI